MAIVKQQAVSEFKVGDHVRIRYRTVQFRPYDRVVEVDCYVSQVRESISGRFYYSFVHERGDGSMGNGPVNIYSLVESIEMKG